MPRRGPEAGNTHTFSNSLGRHLQYSQTGSEESFFTKTCRVVHGALMFRKILKVTSKNEGDIINIMSDVEEAVRESGIQEGLVHLFVQHSTAALTTMEFEPGVVSDFRRALSVLAPDDAAYAHNARWGDGNGRSHVKAALVGPSLTIPLANGAVMCGTWQQIVMLELDVNAGRERAIICSVDET